MTLRARPWRGLAGLAPQRALWRDLVREAGIDPLCNGWDWTESYARAFAREEELFGWAFEDADGPVGLMALRHEPRRGPLALRRALFLADGTFDSDYLEPPVRPGLEPAIARLLVEVACEVRGLEALVLAGMPAESRFLAALRAETTTRGLPTREHPVTCLRAPLPDSMEAYLAGLKPRMRSKVRSAMRSAEQAGARIEWCRDAPDLEPWLEDLYRLHEARWRTEGRPGSYADARRRTFTRALAAAALGAGELCLARLVRGNEVLAVQLGVRKGECYYQIQEGFDPAHEPARVGVALRGLAVSDLIASGARAYDFMAGDSSHKRDWGGLPRACTTLALPLPKWRPRLAYGLRLRVERWRAGMARSPS